MFQVVITPGAYEIESLNKEIETILEGEGHYTEVNYPLTIKPSFSTLGSIVETFRQEPLFKFLPNDSIRGLLGLNASTIYEDHNLSPNPVDNLSSDNVSLDCDISEGVFFKSKRTGVTHIILWI